MLHQEEAPRGITRAPTHTRIRTHTKKMDLDELVALRDHVMANAGQYTIYNMPVRPAGFLDNCSMQKIKCDACGETIDPEEMIVCMPCGHIDLHVGCAEWRFEGQNCWDTTRTISYSERMNEYMQEGVRKGKPQRDLQSAMSELKIIDPHHVPLMVREPRMALSEPLHE